MNSKHLATLALALSAAAVGGAAHARGQADVQWSVSIGSPVVGVAVGSPAYRVAPPRVIVVPSRVVVPARGVAPIGWRDADRDGVPNRFDRRYNPRWDIDGDGVPNRHDHRYNPRGDRDRDGIPNRRDPRPYGR
jgi:hypothetical protein